MKVRPSVKKSCETCKIIRRKGKVMVICEHPKRTRPHGYSHASMDVMCAYKWHVLPVCVLLQERV